MTTASATNTATGYNVRVTITALTPEPPAA